MERKIMNDDDIFHLLSAFGFGLIFGLFIGWATMSRCNISQQEIIDKGFAEWQIVTGTSQVEFKWKEKQ